MKKRIYEIIAELKKEKAQSDYEDRNTNGGNQISEGKSRAFSFCIERLEKLLKKEFPKEQE